MATPTTYTRKTFEIEALQVTEENIEEAAEWCDGIIKESDGKKYVYVNVTRPLNERQKKAYEEMWILKSPSGFKVYTDRAFHACFEEKTV